MEKRSIMQGVLFLLGTIFIVPCFAQKVLTLEDAILLALRHNPNIRNAHIERTLAKFDLRVSENDFEWQYSLDGSAKRGVTYTSTDKSISHTYGLTPKASYKTKMGTGVTVSMPNNYSASGNDNTRYTPSATVTVTQQLLKGFGSTIAQIALLNAYISNEKSKLTLKNAVITQINDVVDKYFGLIQAKQQEFIEGTALKDAIRTEQRNEAMIKAGRLAANENIQAQSNVASHRLTMIDRKNKIFDAEQALRKAIGLIDNNQSIDVAKAFPAIKLEVPDLTKSIAIAMRGNIDYRKQLMELEVTKRALLKAKDDMRWGLAFTGTMNFGGSQPGIGGITRGQDKSRSVGLVLTVPIRDLTLQKGLISAKYNLSKARVALRLAKRDLELDVRNEVNDLQNEKAQIEQADRAIELAARSLELEQKKLELGLSTTLNVTNLRNALVKVELQKVVSLIAYYKARNVYWAKLGITLDKWKIELAY